LTVNVARREQILRLLASSQIGRLFLRGIDGDDDDYGSFGIRRRRRRAALDPNRFPKVPSDQGIELMKSGNFGVNELQVTNTITKKKKLAKRILDRELGMDGGARLKANQRLMAQVNATLRLANRHY
jgi:WD repeat-containing protein 23